MPQDTPNPKPGAQNGTHRGDLLRQALREQWTYYIADLQRYKTALQTAKDIRRPRRKLLAQVYENIMQDPHLQSAVQSRKLRVKSEPLWLVKKGTTEREKELTELLYAPWFDDFLEFAMDTLFWGYTCIQLGKKQRPPLNENGELTGVEQLPREHVVPETGEFLLRPSANSGLNYRQPPYADFIIEAGLPDWLGLLQYAVVDAVFKKRANGAWDRFVQLFGVPIVWAEFDGNLPQPEIEKMDNFLSSMVDAGWARFPQGTQLHYLNAGTQSGGADTFQKRIDHLNSELSKLIMQGTMVQEDGSSRSQSEVHERLNLAARSADMRWLRGLINRELLPRLTNLGYPFGDVEARWEEDLLAEEAELKSEKDDLALTDKWAIDQGILQAGYKIDPEYIEETYGVPLVAGEPPNSPAGEGAEAPEDPAAEEAGGAPPEPPEGPQGSARGLWQRARQALQGPHIRLPDYTNGPCAALHTVAQDPDLETMTKYEEELLRGIFENGPEYDPQYTRLTGALLNEAVGEGWRTEQPSISYDDPDYRRITLMEANVYHFSAAKSWAMAGELNRLAKRAGNFSEFKQNAATVTRNFNENWLKTEYNHVYRSAQQEAHYRRLRERAEEGIYTWWRYETAGDSRVRPAHEKLDGMTLPADDAQWRDLWPPNGWNCRCHIEPVREDEVAEDAKARAEEQAKAFRNTKEYKQMQRHGFDRGPAQHVGEAFDRSKLYARNFDGARLGVRHNGVTPWPQMTGLPEAELPDNTPQDALGWFAERVGANGLDDPQRIRLLDYAGRPLLLTRQTLDNHLTDKYLKEGRQNLITLVPEVLEDPDEVYIRSQKGGYNYVYIKFYKGLPVMVPAKIDNDSALEIKTWFKLKDVDERRNGILVYKK